MYVATLDHGSRLDEILNWKSKAHGRPRDTGAHLSNMAAQRLPVLRAWEGGSASHPH